jgi:hypothetical protein
MCFPDSIGLRDHPDNLLDDFTILVYDFLNWWFFNSTFNDLFNILGHFGNNFLFNNLNFGNFDNFLLLNDSYFSRSDVIVLREVFKNCLSYERTEFLFFKLWFESLIFNVIIFHLRNLLPLKCQKLEFSIIRLKDA